LTAYLLLVKFFKMIGVLRSTGPGIVYKLPPIRFTVTGSASLLVTVTVADDEWPFMSFTPKCSELGKVVLMARLMAGA
jgi:hypothetical protein